MQGKIITVDELEKINPPEGRIVTHHPTVIRLPKLRTAPQLTVPAVDVRIPTDLTGAAGEALSPAEYRRRTKALRKARREKSPAPNVASGAE